MKKLILVFSLIVSCSIAASAQPRQAEKAQPSPTPVVKRTAPESFKAKYQGGMFGYSQRDEGILKFDDVNERLVFFGEDQKEKFAIPYKAMLVVYPSSRKVQSGTGRAVSHIPVPGAAIGGMFMKKKKNYLIIQFRDPDVEVQGTTSFLLDTDELLESVIHTMGEKADLTRRGDAYYRPAEPKKAVL
ncbi:MAG TPA: hypothetical protein VK892_23770 [Pyrinomonadaceae bacterium]|nr:hypothetical protein [Pyrinomonadaceae bacterium]